MKGGIYPRAFTIATKGRPESTLDICSDMTNAVVLMLIYICIYPFSCMTSPVEAGKYKERESDNQGQMLTRLPLELIHEIIAYLSSDDLSSGACVCSGASTGDTEAAGLFVHK